MKGLREALRAADYVEGRNIALQLRSADGRSDRLPELAAELVRSKVDVIVAYLTPAATAAKRRPATYLS
jgi:putative ABC transport system substrate-binding protein